MKTKAFIYIIIAGLLWGTSGIFVHFLKPYGFSSMQMTAMRALVSFLGMAIYALLINRELFKIKPWQLLFFVPVGLTIFSTAYLYYTAMTLTSVSTAVILMYMAPAYVMAFSVFFLGEKFSSLKLVSVCAMMIGCCLVSGIIGGIEFNIIGILLGFLSGVSYAVYNIITKIALRKKCNAASMSVYGFLFMAIAAMALANPVDIAQRAAENPLPTIPLLIGIGLATCVTPYFLYTLAMRNLPAGTASALGIVEPMAATVYSILFLGEDLNILPAIGILLILCAVFLLGKAEDSNTEEEKMNTEAKNGENKYELHQN